MVTLSATRFAAFFSALLRCAAISSIKIEGVQHEFQSIEGIVEDVTDIVLNLKKVLLVSESRETATLVIDVERDGVVTAADIQEDANFKVINPEQVICTLDKTATLPRGARGSCRSWILRR